MRDLICFLILSACVAHFISCEKSKDTLSEELGQSDADTQNELDEMLAALINKAEHFSSTCFTNSISS